MDDFKWLICCNGTQSLKQSTLSGMFLFPGEAGWCVDELVNDKSKTL